jgi:hypothetical protein
VTAPGGPRKSGVLSRHRPPGPSLRFSVNPEQMSTEPAVGGWREVAHPRGLTTVEWEGRPARRVTFPLLLMARTKRGGLDPRGSVERDVALLTSWGQPVLPLQEPPVLRLDYGPAENGLYVLQQATPLTERRRSSDLARYLVELDVQLLEWRGGGPADPGGQGRGGEDLGESAPVGSHLHGPGRGHLVEHRRSSARQGVPVAGAVEAERHP